MVNEVGKYLVDQETGQRGFIITGEESFLEPYFSSGKNLRRSLSELYNLAEKSFDKLDVMGNIFEIEAGIIQWVDASKMSKDVLREDGEIGSAELKELSQTILGERAILENVRYEINELAQKFSIAQNQRAQRILASIENSLTELETSRLSVLITGQHKSVVKFERKYKVLNDQVVMLKDLIGSGYDKDLMNNTSDSFEVEGSINHEQFLR